MNIDLTLPSTLDLLHLGLAALVAILAITQLVFVSIAAMAWMRRGPDTAQASAAPARDSNAPMRVIIEKVPAELLGPRPSPAPEPARNSTPEVKVVKEATPDAALQLLGLLQKEARFVDFVYENVATFGDAEIGAAARIVHDGCRKVLSQYFEMMPVRTENEMSRITLAPGFDASAIRVSGNVVGEPPFTGTLIHRGWRAARINLPKVAEGHDVSVIGPAEVEL